MSTFVAKGGGGLAERKGRDRKVKTSIAEKQSRQVDRQRDRHFKTPRGKR